MNANKSQSNRSRGGIVVPLLVVAGVLVTVCKLATRAARQRERALRDYYCPNDIELNPDAEIGNEPGQYYHKKK